MTGGRGRPLRFLVVLLAGWTGVRAAMLWSVDEAPPAAAAPQEAVGRQRNAATLSVAVAPGAAKLGESSRATAFVPVGIPVPPAVLSYPALFQAPAGPRPSAVVRTHTSGTRAVREARLPAVLWPGGGSPQQTAQAIPGAVAGLPTARPSPTNRWSGSFWLFVRSGGGIAPGTIGGQLGGSQAGARVVYLLDRRHRVSLVGRLAAPLGSGLGEGALAVEWQPTRLPIRLVADQRIAIHGGRGGPGAGVVGGFGPLPMRGGFRLEGYGEAGILRRTRTERYADGALRAAYRLAGNERTHLDLGAGAWAGAQRGAERLDLGPSASLTLAVGGIPARLSLDWRERVAGRARPASGPALTLGADF